MVSAAPAASVGIDSAFAEAASGEWEGHRVYFDGSGAKLTVPERFLPPAFTEWGVEVFDWQSQCAMKVTAEGGMYAKELRFLPTQGCEADASTVESAQERTIAAADVSPALATASVARGSYSCGSRSLGDGGGGEVAVVEHCLRFDFEGKNSGGGDDGPKRARVRVQQTIETQPGSAADAHPDGGVASCAARCDSAWLEFYYEEFKNGASLCASCGGPNKWGESPATDPDDLTGPEWSGDDWDPALVSAGGATMLPHGMWCGAAVTGGSGGGTVLEAGWFIPDRDAVYLPRVRDVETHLISRRIYDAEGQLSSVQFLRRERKAAA